MPFSCSKASYTLCRFSLGSWLSSRLTLGNGPITKNLRPSPAWPWALFSPWICASLSLTHETGPLWISKLAETKPKVSLSFEYCLLSVVCSHWGGGTPKLQVITQITMSTHPQKIYRLIGLKHYGSRDQEALFCFYFFEGEGSVKITICNSPRITLLVRRSLWVFKIKVIWKVLIAFLSILPLHPSLRLS